MENKKKILLIGDSIRIGYDIFVREAFAGKADVYFPDENCRFAEYVLRNLHEWRVQTGCGEDVDCVHWNVGLWDCLILFEDGWLTPIDVYQQYIDRICRRIKLLFPKAKVIFATSTPMHEALFTTPEVSMRYNKDVEAFNAAALEVVQKYGFEVNDLYGFMKDFPLDYHSDVAHYYTKKGAMAITGKVLRSLEECLGLEAGKVDFDGYFAETECFEGLAWLEKRTATVAATAAELGV